MGGHEDMSKETDGFRVENQYLLAGSDVPYRVRVTVEYPARDDLAPDEDPFHENIRVNIENMVLLRLLNETTEQARVAINEYFPTEVAPTADLC